MLNNQPMGFYSPAVLIKDAQRHGLRVLPVDVMESDWDCTVEGRARLLQSGAGARVSGPNRTIACQPDAPDRAAGPPLRLGLRYARGLREEAGRAIVRARPFSSIDDLALRVPELRKDEIKRLAEIGALNSVGGAARRLTGEIRNGPENRGACPTLPPPDPLASGTGASACQPIPSKLPARTFHRRDALWQAQRATLPVGPLLEPQEETGEPSPLAPMDTEERLWADYRGTGLTIGRHPMAHRRAEMNALGVTRAAALARMPNGRLVRIAGSVIVRQRPGTAKGFVFLSVEDETGVFNVILDPNTFDRFKFVVLTEPFLLIDGVLQNVDDVVSVKAARVAALPEGAAAEVHNFR
jgi:error-prone DNA polymerase